MSAPDAAPAQMPEGLRAVLAQEPTNERWLAAWAMTLRMPEGPEREQVLDVIADWACGLSANGRNDRTGEMSGPNADLRAAMRDALRRYDAEDMGLAQGADAILETIAAAGLVVVEGERFERLRECAQARFTDNEITWAGRRDPWAQSGLVPGDLDAVEGAS